MINLLVTEAMPKSIKARGQGCVLHKILTACLRLPKGLCLIADLQQSIKEGILQRQRGHLPHKEGKLLQKILSGV